MPKKSQSTIRRGKRKKKGVWDLFLHISPIEVLQILDLLALNIRIVNFGSSVRKNVGKKNTIRIRNRVKSTRGSVNLLESISTDLVLLWDCLYLARMWRYEPFYATKLLSYDLSMRISVLLQLSRL